MIDMVISGFQTGADMGGILAARDAGIATGGWMPKGWLTEAGPRPEYAGLYGAREHESPSYAARTRANVDRADAVLIFAAEFYSRGTRLTGDYSYSSGKSYIKVRVSEHNKLPYYRQPKAQPKAVASWIIRDGFGTLLVAGNRESRAPGIEAWVREYMGEVFRIMREINNTRSSHD